MHVDSNGGNKVMRFKDEDACLETFRNHTKLVRRCLVTRAVYAHVEAGDLGIDNTKNWKVKSYITCVYDYLCMCTCVCAYKKSTQYIVR